MTALKTLLAAALAAPLAVLAQDKPAAPAFQIYGMLNVNLQYTGAGDATAGSASDVSNRWAVSSDSTNIGIRGAVDVAHGLKAIFQCETAAAIDASTGSLCGRNSRLGISSEKLGTLFYGTWDTPFKAGTYGTKANDPFGNTDVFGFQGIMGSPGFNVRSAGWLGAAPAPASFDIRATNSVAYWSPKFSGVSAKFQWATDEARNATGIVTPALYGGAVNFDQGGLSLVAAVELHDDAFGIRTMNGANSATLPSRDMAWRLSAGYELPLAGGSLRVLGMFEQLSYEQDDSTLATQLDDWSRMAFLAGATFKTGMHELRLRYAQAMEPSCTLGDGTDCPDAATADFGAKQLAVGYGYSLAKTTEVYAFFTQIMNDDAATYTFTIGGSPAVAGATPAGADPTAYGVGIRHTF